MTTLNTPLPRHHSCAPIQTAYSHQHSPFSTHFPPLPLKLPSPTTSLVTFSSQHKLSHQDPQLSLKPFSSNTPAPACPLQIRSLKPKSPVFPLYQCTHNFSHQCLLTCSRTFLLILLNSSPLQPLPAPPTHTPPLPPILAFNISPTHTNPTEHTQLVPHTTSAARAPLSTQHKLPYQRTSPTSLLPPTPSSTPLHPHITHLHNTPYLLHPHAPYPLPPTHSLPRSPPSSSLISLPLTHSH